MGSPFGSSGGSSVELPEEIEAAYEELIGSATMVGDNQLIDIMNKLYTDNDAGQVPGYLGNPLSNFVSYDPGGDLGYVIEKFERLHSKVSEMSVIPDFKTYMKTIKEWHEDNFADSYDIDTEVDLFEDDMDVRYARMISQFNAGMSDIRAVMTSSFDLGIANLTAEKAKEIARKRSELELAYIKVKYDFQYNGMNILAKYDEFLVNNLKIETMLAAEIKKMTVAAYQDYEKQRLSIKIEEHLWDMKLFQMAGSFLGSASGGVVSDPPKAGWVSTVASVASIFASLPL